MATLLKKFIVLVWGTFNLILYSFNIHIFGITFILFLLTYFPPHLDIPMLVFKITWITLILNWINVKLIIGIIETAAEQMEKNSTAPIASILKNLKKKRGRNSELIKVLIR